MADEFKRNVFIAITREAYQGFFSDDWGERIESLTRPAKKLYPLTFDLLMDWRAAAYTASLPLSIILHLKAYHDGYVNKDLLNTNLLQLAQVVPGLLARDFPVLTVNPADLRAIKAKLVDIGAKYVETRSGIKVDFPLDETWRSYLEDYVFQLTLWGSQKLCYVAIYNSYENFIVHCTKLALNLKRCRSNTKEFKNQFAQAYGEPLRDKCWTNDKLHLVREARHSLSHAGGRLIENLPKDHGFVVKDERIQVTPEKTKELIALLQDCVYSLAEKAITLPEFA